MSKALKKAIKDYDLKLIHTGSLSKVPNDRYLRSNHNCFDINTLGKDLTSEKFVLVFNYAECDANDWSVYETPYMNFEKAKEIYQIIARKPTSILVVG